MTAWSQAKMQSNAPSNALFSSPGDLNEFLIKFDVNSVKSNHVNDNVVTSENAVKRTQQCTIFVTW